MKHTLLGILIGTLLTPFVAFALPSVTVPMASTTGDILQSLPNGMWTPTASTSLPYATSTSWGQIIGNITNQTDLQNEFNNYLSTTSAHNTYLPLSASTSLPYIPFASSSLYYLNTNPAGYISSTTAYNTYVPYTGATKNIDIGDNFLKNGTDSGYGGNTLNMTSPGGFYYTSSATDSMEVIATNNTAGIGFTNNSYNPGQSGYLFLYSYEWQAYTNDGYGDTGNMNVYANSFNYTGNSNGSYVGFQVDNNGLTLWDTSASQNFNISLNIIAGNTIFQNLTGGSMLFENPISIGTYATSSDALYVVGTSTFNDNVGLKAGLFDSNNVTGTKGSILTSTGTSTAWLAPSSASMEEDTDATTTGSTLSLTTANQFYAWRGASSTDSYATTNGTVTASSSLNATSSFIIGANGGGLYQITFNMSFNISSGANQQIHCAAFKNSTQLDHVIGESSLTNSRDTDNIGGGDVGYRVALVPNDVITLRCSNESSSGKTLTFQHVNFGINRTSQ